jgi:hypothetical protein
LNAVAVIAAVVGTLVERAAFIVPAMLVGKAPPDKLP